jgi:hypothetical protein
MRYNRWKRAAKQALAAVMLYLLMGGVSLLLLYYMHYLIKNINP